jgi:hypothetical protein
MMGLRVEWKKDRDGRKKVVETAGDKSSFMYVGQLYLTSSLIADW